MKPDRHWENTVAHAAPAMPPQPEHRHRVQNDIGDRGCDHGIQGRLAVTDSPEHRGAVVKEYHCRETCKEDPYIKTCHLLQLDRDPQCPQKHRQQQLRQRCARNGNYGAQKCGLPGDPAQSRQITLSEFLGDPDAKALAEALGKTDEKPVQPIHSPQSCQSIDADTLPYNGGIHYRVKLLEHVAEHQWQRKRKQKTHGLAPGHIQAVCHGKTSNLKILPG